MFSLMSTLGVKVARSVTWVTRRACSSEPETTATFRPTSRVSWARFWAVTVIASSSVTFDSAAWAAPAARTSTATAAPPSQPDCLETRIRKPSLTSLARLFAVRVFRHLSLHG